MTHQPRVTMRDIAKAANVSPATVSLSLRNHPSLPEATRKRIREAAWKMGYRPDPFLAALNNYRNTSHQASYRATLGWIHGSPPKSMHGISDFHRYFLGARRRAQELGYGIEEFWIYEPGMTAARFSQIMTSRSIQGLLFPPLPMGVAMPELDWERFSVVAFGFSHSSRFHIVTNAQNRSARLATEQLIQRGYRRIGSFAHMSTSLGNTYNFFSGIWVECFAQGLKPLLLEIPEKEDRLEVNPRVLKWIREEKPDAILTQDPKIFDFLARNGIRVPQDIAVAMLNRNPDDPPRAGIDQNPLEIGATAVNQLAGMLQRNEWGVPKTPLRILVDGFWIDGPTAPPRAETGKAAPSIKQR